METFDRLKQLLQKETNMSARIEQCKHIKHNCEFIFGNYEVLSKCAQQYNNLFSVDYNLRDANFNGFM
jgi:hypothetical protein